MIKYKVQIQQLAAKVGIENASQLRAAMSKEHETISYASAYSLWDGKTSTYSQKMIDLLCHVLGCHPGELWVPIYKKR